MNEKIGIYCIKNQVNNKMYIGSSLNILRRFREHKKVLKYEVHHSYHLQNAWNKYGEDSFSFEILETFSDSTILIQRELDLILKYKTNDRVFGYNIALPNPAGNGEGVSKHSDETKELLRRIYYKTRFKNFIEEEYQVWLLNIHKRKVRIYKNRKEWERYHKCPIVVLNLQGQIVNRYTSIHETCRELNLNVKKVNDYMSQRVLNKKTNASTRKSIKGYMFVRESEYDETKDYTYKQERRHSIVCIKGDFNTEYESPQEASDKLGIKIGRIYEVLRGYSKTCSGGYVFKYKEEFAKKFK